MARHAPADVKKSYIARVRIRDEALPFVLAPAVHQVDGAPPDAGEIVHGLLQRPVEVLHLERIDGAR